MYHAALHGIVDGPPLGLVLHPGAMPVRGRQHGAAAGATGDELGREMRDGQGGAGSRTTRNSYVRRERRPRHRQIGGQLVGEEAGRRGSDVLLRPWTIPSERPG